MPEPNVRRAGLRGVLHRGQHTLSAHFRRIVERCYQPFLRMALRYRYITATAAPALFWVVGSFSLSAHMGMILMPAGSAH